MIAGQLDGFTGTSITNASEALAGEVAHELLDDSRRFRLIEHWPHSLAVGGASFREVRFEPGDPSELGHTGQSSTSREL